MGHANTPLGRRHTRTSQGRADELLLTKERDPPTALFLRLMEARLSQAAEMAVFA